MTGTLLYDPDCGFCTRCAGLLQRWRLGCTVLPMDDGLLARHGVDPARAAREIPFVDGDGGVLHGSAAIAAALRTGPLPARLAGRMLQLPVVRSVAAVVYRVVARNRHRLPGGSASCRLDTTRAPSPGGDDALLP